jgi:hypothetical protein
LAIYKPVGIGQASGSTPAGFVFMGDSRGQRLWESRVKPPAEQALVAFVGVSIAKVKLEMVA